MSATKGGPVDHPLVQSILARFSFKALRAILHALHLAENQGSDVHLIITPKRGAFCAVRVWPAPRATVIDHDDAA